MQYSLKAGIKQFGKAGEEAAVSEMKQLHDRKTWKPLKKKDLTQEDIKKAIGSLIFLKQKRDIT